MPLPRLIELCVEHAADCGHYRWRMSNTALIHPDNRRQPKDRKLNLLAHKAFGLERYGLTYTSGPMVEQLRFAWKKVFRLSLPNDALR